MTVDFKKTLLSKQKPVWEEIQSYLEDLSFKDSAIPKRYSSLIAFHKEMASDYPKRKGKYVRPTLLLLTAQAMGASEKKATKTAAAMQLSEEWILIHDDLEDDSLKRRGKDALHRIYGTELAVNAGDALHALMWKMLADNKSLLRAEKTFELIDEFSKMLNRTVLGQTFELKWAKENNLDLCDDDYFFIVDGKTVYYTIAGPMRLGAIVAGANKSQLEKIFEFARPLGRCFQIRDDLLDITSDFGGLKKQIGNDVYEGKRTLILIHLLRSAKGKDKKEIIKILKKTRDEKTEEEVRFIIDLMKKYKSIDYAQKKAEGLALEAREIFDRELSFLARSPAREELKAAVDFILNRDH